MAAVHDILRYLLDRVPHSTQEDKDRIADLIEQDANPASTPEPVDDKKDES